MEQTCMGGYWATARSEARLRHSHGSQTPAGHPRQYKSDPGKGVWAAHLLHHVPLVWNHGHHEQHPSATGSQIQLQHPTDRSFVHPLCSRGHCRPLDGGKTSRPELQTPRPSHGYQNPTQPTIQIPAPASPLRKGTPRTHPPPGLLLLPLRARLQLDHELQRPRLKPSDSALLPRGHHHRGVQYVLDADY